MFFIFVVQWEKLSRKVFQLKNRERVTFRISFSYSYNVFLLAISFVVTEIEQVKNGCATPLRRLILRSRKLTRKSVRRCLR